jgi:hypothetical protein
MYACINQKLGRTMRISQSNPKKNISFRGIEQDIKFSRAIVRDIRSKVPNITAGYYYIQKKKHPENKEKFEKLLHDAFYRDIAFSRESTEWRSKLKNAPFQSYLDKLQELMVKFRLGYCGDHQLINKQKHSDKGVPTRLPGFYIFGSGFSVREHGFVLRNLPSPVDITNPKTWGNAVLVDSWCDNGIVGKAILPEEKERFVRDEANPCLWRVQDKNTDSSKKQKQGALFKVLEYFSFDSKTEPIRFIDNEAEEA